MLGTDLIRLQCYEGLDVSTAVYEWNYARQMMRIRLAGGAAGRAATSRFEEARPVRPRVPDQAPAAAGRDLPGPGRPVLLIDELDRADEEFEAFLLELLSDFQITVPEVGTFRPQQPPAVVITSNRTREIHDALKRRCLYHWIEYPDFEKELAVLAARLPDTPRTPGAAGGQPGAAVAPDGPLQAARRGRDARLDGGPPRPGTADADRGGRDRHPGRAAQAPGRHRAPAGANANRDGAEGGAAGGRTGSTREMNRQHGAGERSESPIMTRELAGRMQDTYRTRAYRGDEKCVQRLEGNPYACGSSRLAAWSAPWPWACRAGWWNRVKGVSTATADWLDEVLALYRDNGVRCFIDLAPGDFTEEIAARLALLGLYAIPNGVVLYGPCRTVESPLPEGVEIRELGRTEEELDLFARLWADGFELPPGPETETALRIRRGFFEPPDNHLYVLYDHGKPAAMAAGSIKHGIGYLNVGATLPEYRGRGYHTYLTQRRVVDAARAGCDLMMGFIGTFGSTSQHNMERAGLRIAYLLTTYVDGRVPAAS